jgi:hypothetical protein
VASRADPVRARGTSQTGASRRRAGTVHRGARASDPSAQCRSPPYSLGWIVSVAAGGPKEPDPGPACSLQSGRSHAGHPRRAARRPIGSVRHPGVLKDLTTDNCTSPRSPISADVGQEILGRQSRGLHYVGDWHTHPSSRPSPARRGVSEVSGSTTAPAAWAAVCTAHTPLDDVPVARAPSPREWEQNRAVSGAQPRGRQDSRGPLQPAAGGAVASMFLMRLEFASVNPRFGPYCPGEVAL